MNPYEAGYDCGKNGPNQTNCDFRLFATPFMTRSWELGKKDAESGRPMRKEPK